MMANPPLPVIATEALKKHFGEVAANDQISLTVEKGEIYGFLGLNGSGKTTLIRILLGMIKPDGGNVRLFGKPVDTHFDLWNKVGYLVETPNAYPELTVLENLMIFYYLRGLKDKKAIDQIISQLQLDAYRNKKAKDLSLGNKQRLGLAKALMHQPELLILDEPINGLDPEGIVEVRELLKSLSDNGCTIFLSSHILSEIAKISNRTGIIHQGRLIKELNNEELGEQLQKYLLVKTENNELAMQHLNEMNIESALNDNREIEISNALALSHPEQITGFLSSKNLPPRQVYTVIEDLEMFFLRTIHNH